MERGATHVAFAPRFVTNSVDAAISHVELGFGMTMALAYQVEDSVREGRLEVVLRKFESPPIPIQLVYATRRHLSVSVRTFAEMVATTCDWQFVRL